MRRDPSRKPQVRRIAGVLGLALLAAAGSAALNASAPAAVAAIPGATAWTVEQGASRLVFRSTASGAPFEGVFRRWEADIRFDPKDLAGSRAVVTIDMASAVTGDEMRDEAIPDPEWFDVARFARATFTAERFRPLGGDRYEAAGELEIRGVRRPAILPFTVVIAGDQARMQGELVLDRTTFGVGQGQWRSKEIVPFEVTVAVTVTAHRAGTTPPATASAPAAPAVPGPKVCSYGPYAADTYRPAPAFPGQTRAPAPRPSPPFKVETVADGFEHPWAVAFLPDGRMLVTERPGRLRMVARDGRVSEPLAGLPPLKSIGNAGLFDLVLDPQFAKNRTLYFGYFAPAPGETAAPEARTRWTAWLRLPHEEREKHRIGIQKVARARLSADGHRLEDVQVLAESGLDGRIVVAPDGNLLITSGTVASGDLPVDDLPQRLDLNYGKVLRIARTGAVPKDNPFVGRPGVRPEIFAYGLRDPQSAAINPRTGELWTAENGPRGGDELNIVRAGRNYGFPTIGYGREYSGDLINGGLTAKAGLEQPVYFWTPSIAPSGLMFYTGRLFPQWRGDLFMGAQAGKRLVRMVLKGDRVVAEEPLLVDLCERIRDVRQGPDGAIYVLTESASAKLLRLTPAIQRKEVRR